MTTEACIKPSGDSKVRFRKTQKNTFGLLPGLTGTCPKATVGLGGCSHIQKNKKLPICYVFRLMRVYKNVGPVLEHNTKIIKQANYADKVNILKKEFQRFKTAELKQKTPKLYYRIHWSGDVYDLEYAKALSEAMRAFPEIQFWNYTRTFEVAEYLANNTPNLVQYLSLDPVNFSEGIQVFSGWLKSNPPYDNLTICYMNKVNDFNDRLKKEKESKDNLLNFTPKLMGCPVDENIIPIEGGCAACRMCLIGRPVWFKT